MNENVNRDSYTDGIELSLWDIARILLQKFHWLLIAGIAAAAIVYLAVSFLVTPTYA